MARYTFKRRKGGELVEVSLSYDEYDNRVSNGTIKLDDGEIADRDFASDWAGRRGTGDLYPRPSDALGVAPHQRKAAIQESIRKGVPTDYDERGRAVIRDVSHQNALLKMKGQFNMDPGYRDYSGR